jgi:hypothetical protein
VIGVFSLGVSLLDTYTISQSLTMARDGKTTHLFRVPIVFWTVVVQLR